MKRYFTKTGIELKVIQGEGLGDGIPRGQLTEVTHRDEYDMTLIEKFKDAFIVIERNSYDNSTFQLNVTFKIDAALYSVPSKRHDLIGMLAIDVSNYLSRFHNFKEYVVPTVDLNIRASQGRKTLVFSYSIQAETARNMGLAKFQTSMIIKTA